MHALSEMIALDMKWTRTRWLDDGEDYALLYGEELVAQAEARWQRLVRYDLTLWSGEGCFQAHMNLADPGRQSVVSNYGSNQSLGTFLLGSEGEITAKGIVQMADTRRLEWEPTHPLSLEYVIRPIEGGDPLIKMIGVPDASIGGNPGYMNIGLGLGGDASMPALVALCFALTNEQGKLLHRLLQHDKPRV